MRRDRRSSFALGAALLVLGGGVAWATAGDLDGGYGAGGIATAAADAYSEASAMAVQSGGRVVLCGHDGSGAWQLERFDASGAQDAAFAAAALAANLAGGPPRALALDGDDVLAAGTATWTVSGPKGKPKTVTASIVARFLEDGTPDVSFGSGGRVDVGVPGAVNGSSYVRSLAVDASGRILAAGVVSLKGPTRRSPPQDGWFVARLLGDGSLDAAFGADGFAVYDPTTDDDRPWPRRGLVVLADGSAVVGGSVGATATGTPGTWHVARFSPGGAVQATVTRASADGAYLALDSNARVVALGRDRTTGQALVARYLASGSGLAVDAGFGSSGETPISAPAGYSAIVDLQPAVDGGDRIVVGASVRDASDATRLDACVVRLTATGALDAGFGTGGFAGPIDVDAVDRVYGTAVDDSGRILVGGHAIADWFAARLLSD